MINVLSIIYKLSMSPAIIENGESMFWEFIVDCVRNLKLIISSSTREDANLEVRKAVLKFNRSLSPQLNVFQIERLVIALSHSSNDLIDYAMMKNINNKIACTKSTLNQIKCNNAKSNMIIDVFDPKGQLLLLYEQARTYPLGALKERMNRVFTLCENDIVLRNSLAEENAIELFWLYEHMGVDLSSKY